MFPSRFPKPPCSWNVGSAPRCYCLCNSLLETNKHGGIEQELLGHQPWRRSKECRMHVDRPNRTEIMINRIPCRFKWDGSCEWRQSSFLAAGVLLLLSQPLPPRKWCVPCGFSAWSWAWRAQCGYGAFISLLAFSPVLISQSSQVWVSVLHVLAHCWLSQP